ncbi:hypothetical protein B0H15DRAFT_952576 [Mycena belliarum]|uniref:Uncharacterized protein n=1 Tax=Mycena belliarum TaxID=1033014 RepID=A0AAD6U259_9AGAR|nr:hypothetical protein B0H15DRAFT_952576 [Mycena belliae]
MTTVVGDSSESSFTVQRRPRVYPSPSSSPEGVPSPVTSQSIPPKLSFARGQTEKKVFQPTSGLHTPRPSEDVASGPPVHGRNTFEAEVQRIEASIHALLPSSPIEPLQLRMSVDVAHAVEDKMCEDRRFKLEYDGESKMLIVEYPTNVHESFKSIVAPFSHIVDVNDSFIIHTGIDIQTRNEIGALQKRTPDCAFGKRPSAINQDPIYGIILECGYSQTSIKLQQTLQHWFSVPGVEAVILLKFFCGQLALPGSDVPLPEEVADRPTFLAAAPSSGLGPINFGGYTWAPAITKVELSINIRATQGSFGQIFDITPVDDDDSKAALELEVSKKKISRLLYTLTSEFMGDDQFKAIFPTRRDFNIRWETFMPNMQGYLATDGWERPAVVFVLWSAAPRARIDTDAQSASASEQEVGT